MVYVLTCLAYFKINIMENQDQRSDIFGLQFDEPAKNSIKTMTTWAMIMVVVTLLSVILSFVEYFKTRRQIDALAGEYEFGGGRFSSIAKGGSLAGIVISTLISLLLCYFLYQFSTRSKSGIDGMNTTELNKGLAGLKNYFLTTGILIIIIMAFLLIALLFVGSMGAGY